LKVCTRGTDEFRAQRKRALLYKEGKKTTKKGNRLTVQLAGAEFEEKELLTGVDRGERMAVPKKGGSHMTHRETALPQLGKQARKIMGRLKAQDTSGKKKRTGPRGDRSILDAPIR